MERALGQMQSLVDQLNDPTPTFDERTEYFYTLNYPDFFTLSAILAEHWMKSGCMQSGYEIFKKLQMWDECIECIVSIGDMERALKEIDQLKATGMVSLRISCIQGEIKRDPQILKRVWRDSNKSFARAQRSLGDYYFYIQKDYKKCIKSLRKALKINSYHAKSWLIVGCSHMRLNQLDEAIQAFGQCVTVDEKDVDAWGNLSNCLQMQQRYKEAMSTLEQALKFSERDWKIYSNLLNLSLKNLKFNRFYSCIEKLIVLDHVLIILRFIIFIERGDKRNDIQQNKLDLQILALELLAIQFQIVKDQQRTRRKIELGQNFEVWSSYGIFCESRILFEQLQHDENKNSQQQFSEQQQQHSLETVIQLIREEIAESNMKSCQMLMKIGWETDKQNLISHKNFRQICSQLEQQLATLIQSFKYINDENEIKHFRIFIDTVVGKLQTVLGHKINDF